ncbi:SIR2 family protein [bacterium AH-315-J21]|nr:SIR2 family protein [bacterium AH-315-J21]
MMDIAFIIGAGLSKAAGMPDVNEMTTYCTGVSGDVSDCIKIIHKVFGKWYEKKYPNAYRNGWAPNYEDIYYICDHTARKLMGRYVDPLAEPAIQQIIELHRIRKIDNFESDLSEDYTLKLVQATMSHIRQIVFEQLKIKPISVRNLKPLGDAISSLASAGHTVHIFSLNHDLLLESLLKTHGINYCDGFSSDKDRNAWEPELYETSVSSVFLYKLHGSIDWHREFIPQYYPKIFTRKDEPLEYEWNSEDYPEFLIGTLNKFVEYTQGIYLDLICLLNKRIASCSNVITIGYSFGDQGVSNVIAKWWWGSRDNKVKQLSILAPNAENLREQFKNTYDRLHSSGLETGGNKWPRCVALSGKIEEFKWDEKTNNFVKQSVE